MGLALGLLAVMAGLLAASETAAQAVREGLALCGGSVIPALFPFLVVSRLFVATGQRSGAGAAAGPLDPPDAGDLRPRWYGDAAGSAGRLSGGRPDGGRAGPHRGSPPDRRDSGCCCSATTGGPAFALGVAGVGCFGSLRAGAWLWLIHVSAAVLTALLTRSTSSPEGRTSPSAPQALSSAFPGAVRGAGEGMLHVCGFVVFFLVLTRLLTALTGLEHPLPLDCWSLPRHPAALRHTGGLRAGGGTDGLGGVCVHCQTAAVLEGSGLHMRGYLSAKAAQAVLSAALAVPVSRWVR